MTPPPLREDVVKVLEYLPRVLSLLAQGKLYANWGAEFSWKETDKVLDKFTEEVAACNLPWRDLTAAELYALGFGRWSDDTEVRLIPIYLYWAIPEDTVVFLYDGVGTKKLSEVDTDNRFGLLAYGFVPKDVPTAPRVEDGRLVRAAKEDT